MAFLVLLGLGWLIASILGGMVIAFLSRARFSDWVHRSGVGAALGDIGVELDAIGFVALIAKWFIKLIALVVAFDALGLPAVANTLRQLLLWLPNVVVALVILVIGGLAANALRARLRTGLIGAELGNAALLAAIAHIAVWICATVLALSQLGIASELMTSVFTTLVAGLALALGLAFGLGGREVASEIIRAIYGRLRASETFGKGHTLPRTQQRSPLRREHS